MITHQVVSQAAPFVKSGLARLEAEVVYSEHICSGKMLLLLSHWIHGIGAEASLVTVRQEAFQLNEAV